MRTIQRDGRTWTVDDDGISTLKRRYTIILDENNLGPNGEMESLTAYGIPAIGSKHPNYDYLVVSSYDIEEGEDSEKKLIRVTVNYSIPSSDNGGGGETDDEQVESWEWQSGTIQREVTTNLFTSQGASEHGYVLNSAGDPFDSVPVAEYPSPVFTKTVKTTQRKDWLNLNCKINQNTITIGSMECKPKTLMANITESRIIGDRKWKYRYTVSLHYQSNMSMYGSGEKAIEFGWDIPLVDTGMRELNAEGKLEVIMQLDQETKKPTAITSPELLDGSGHVVKRVDGERPRPYIIRLQAYETATFPSEIYSEPA